MVIVVERKRRDRKRGGEGRANIVMILLR
jgi:hypothetical protein